MIIFFPSETKGADRLSFNAQLDWTHAYCNAYAFETNVQLLITLIFENWHFNIDFIVHEMKTKTE